MAHVDMAFVWTRSKIKLMMYITADGYTFGKNSSTNCFGFFVSFFLFFYVVFVLFDELVSLLFLYKFNVWLEEKRGKEALPSTQSK